MAIKILVDAHVFDGKYQGTVSYLKGLYNRLVTDSDFEIFLAAKDTENLKTHFEHPAFRFVKLTALGSMKRLLLEMPALVKKYGADYSHYQYIVPPRCSARIINTVHDVLFLDMPQYFPRSYRTIKGPLFRFSAKKADIVCTVSEYSRRAIVRHFGVDEEKIVVTPNAANPPAAITDIRQKYGLDKFILYVSRIEPRKNHLLLLEAFVDLRLYEKGYRLVFIGHRDISDAAYEHYYQALLPSIKEKILHLAGVSPDELAGFYRFCSVFVYPSLGEGFGIPPLEAAIHGCKVLCANNTAMSDFSFFGKYLFDANDKALFRTLLEGILMDHSYPSDAIRQAVTDRFSWQKSADAFGQFVKADYRRSLAS